MPDEKDVTLKEIAVIGNLLLQELQDIHRTLKKRHNKQIQRKSRVDELVAAILLRDGNKDWTAAALGREIGVTGQYVGRCAVWKKYCKMKDAERRDIAHRRENAVKENNADSEYVADDE